MPLYILPTLAIHEIYLSFRFRFFRRACRPAARAILKALLTCMIFPF
jgi:hypothetical protein